MFNELPDEMVLAVLGFLSKVQISRLAPTNKTFARCGKLLVPEFSKTIRLDTLATISCKEYRDLKLFCTHDKKGKIFLVWQYRWAIFGKEGGKNYLECVVFDMASQKSNRDEVRRCIGNKVIAYGKFRNSEENKLEFELLCLRTEKKERVTWNIENNKICFCQSMYDIIHSQKCEERPPYCLESSIRSFKDRNMKVVLYKPTPRRLIGHVYIDAEHYIDSYIVNTNYMFILSILDQKQPEENSILCWRGFRNLDFKDKICEHNFKLEGVYMFRCFFPRQGSLLIASRKTDKTACLALYSFPVKLKKVPRQPYEVQAKHE